MAAAIVLCRRPNCCSDQQGTLAVAERPRPTDQITNVLIYVSMALGMAATLFFIPLTGAIASVSSACSHPALQSKASSPNTFSGIALEKAYWTAVFWNQRFQDPNPQP
jgi:hypothetical protein